MEISENLNSPNFSYSPPEIAVFLEKVTVIMEGIRILDDVTANVPKGSCTAIIGPNGAGKTTLLLALLNQMPYSGQIILNNPKNPVIRYVPQRLEFDRTMPMTVADLLSLELQTTPLWWGICSKTKQRIEETLSLVKAEKLYSHRLGTLSGGELQRVLLALSLLIPPDILVLDEPAANIDIQGELLLCEILENLRKTRGFTQIMVSHDLPLVISHATHVICLNHKVVSEGCPQKVLHQPGVLEATFGIHARLQNYFAFQKEFQYPCDMRCSSKGHKHPTEK